MKKMFLVAFVLLCSASFGGEYENCLNECKAKKGTLADFECPNIDCRHLNPNREDIDNITGDYTGNHAPSLGAAVSVGGAVIVPNR